VHAGFGVAKHPETILAWQSSHRHVRLLVLFLKSIAQLCVQAAPAGSVRQAAGSALSLRIEAKLCDAGYPQT
jgi:hypothetical protein